MLPFGINPQGQLLVPAGIPLQTRLGHTCRRSILCPGIKHTGRVREMPLLILHVRKENSPCGMPFRLAPGCASPGIPRKASGTRYNAWPQMNREMAMATHTSEHRLRLAHVIRDRFAHVTGLCITLPLLPAHLSRRPFIHPTIIPPAPQFPLLAHPPCCLPTCPAS